jgi:hypothetical protein
MKAEWEPEVFSLRNSFVVGACLSSRWKVTLITSMLRRNSRNGASISSNSFRISSRLRWDMCALSYSMRNRVILVRIRAGTGLGSSHNGETMPMPESPGRWMKEKE